MGLRSRILWFGIAGISGFIVDAGILTLLTTLGLDSRPARLASFACALVATWVVNRSTTFGDRTGPPGPAEFLRYASASLVAASINLAVFMLLVSFGSLFRAWPILALAVATGLSMCVNFWSYLKIVFKKKHDAA